MTGYRGLAFLLPTVCLLAGGPAYAQGTEGNPEAGEKVFHQCQACHSIQPGQNRVGPSLSGVVGRKSGTEPHYNYSPAMKSANIIWTPANLDKYLADPKAVVPGNKMPFPGLKSEEDRENVIAFLEQHSKK